ncbi:MAG: DUF885 domain-containing protein [Planctomycetia bacterium]|nr:DUF885 domain-containing protein [Planctomycetia bacterium]
MSSLLVLSLVLAAGPEDAKLEAAFSTYLAKLCEQRPATATALGEHAHDHRIDDLSAEGRKTREGLTRETLKVLNGLDEAKLSPASKVDLDIFRMSLRRELWASENLDVWANDPLLFNEFLSDSVYQIFASSTLPRERNVRNAVARIAQLPTVIDAAKASLKNPPKVTVETAIARNKGAIAFYSTGIYELSGEKPGSSPLKPVCDKMITALKDYQTFLEKELLPRATGDWRLGRTKFAAKLELELDAGRSADEVLADAEAEAERVTREMAVVARQLWHRAYPKVPLPADDEAGRRETVSKVLAHFNKDHGKPEELMAEAKALSTKIRAFITAKDILRLPDPDRCQIIEMPEFQRGFSLAYLNPAPPLDPRASSYYAISPPPAGWDARRVESLLQEYNRAMMAILTIHEAYPGHYVQLEYSNRHPSFIRKVLQSGVFIEGWAVYTEQMMLDQGYGDGDLVLRLNQLKFYLRAVINAILDHHMHCKDMTDEQAMKLLVGRGFQSEGEALGKVVRAKLSSCQLSTYFVGRMAWYRLRQTVQREMGDKFDLGRYHEACLSHGSVPMKHVPVLVRERLKLPR